ncbi:MAG: hypothetical protein WAU11_05510 [Ignavibacteriaceae bacterium]
MTFTEYKAMVDHAKSIKESGSEVNLWHDKYGFEYLTNIEPVLRNLNVKLGVSSVYGVITCISCNIK